VLMAVDIKVLRGLATAPGAARVGEATGTIVVEAEVMAVQVAIVMTILAARRTVLTQNRRIWVLPAARATWGTVGLAEVRCV